jgi:integrase/recombinase XerD
MKLSTVIEGFFLAKSLNVSPNTVRNYRYFFSYLHELLGDPEFDSITSNDVRRYLAWLRDERGLSDRSVHDAWIPLSSLWTWAEAELGCKHIVRGAIPEPKFNEEIPDPYSEEEVKKLMAAAKYEAEWTTPSGNRTRSRRPDADRLEAILIVLLDTGIRASELCDLTLADYDQRRGRLHIRQGKGNKQRFVPLGNRAKSALWKYLSRRNAKKNDPLFATRNGTKMDRNNLRRMISSLGETAGVEGAFVHRFRHTFAINFLRNGGNVLLLKELLGHASLDMVQRYARLADADIDSGSQFSTADKWRI